MKSARIPATGGRTANVHKQYPMAKSGRGGPSLQPQSSPTPGPITQHTDHALWPFARERNEGAEADGNARECVSIRSWPPLPKPPRTNFSRSCSPQSRPNRVQHVILARGQKAPDLFQTLVCHCHCLMTASAPHRAGRSPAAASAPVPSPRKTGWTLPCRPGGA